MRESFFSAGKKQTYLLALIEVVFLLCIPIEKEDEKVQERFQEIESDLIKMNAPPEIKRRHFKAVELATVSAMPFAPAQIKPLTICVLLIFPELGSQ